MLGATVVFALTWIVQLDGYKDDEVKTASLILGLGAESLLVAGGYIGGTIVFVYGVRALKRLDVRVADALVPGRAESDPLAELQVEAGKPPVDPRAR